MASRAAGQFHYFRYNVGAPAFLHERLTLLPGYILTPDDEVYAESDSAGGDSRAVHDSAGQGDAIVGVAANELYKFWRQPSAAVAWAAARSCVAQGHGPLAPSPFILELSADNVLGVAKGVLAVFDPLGAAPAAAAPGALALAGAAAPPAGAPGPPAASAATPVGELGALAAALGAGGAALPAAAGPPGVGAAAAAPAAPGAAGSDPRVLATVLDARGVRDMPVRGAVKRQTETPRADWPAKGLTTTMRVLHFMLRMAGGATAWLNRWMAIKQASETDDADRLCETLRRVVETSRCRDQLIICELSSYEVVSRQLLTIGHFLGTGDTMGNSCIFPPVMDWIAEQMKTMTFPKGAGQEGPHDAPPARKPGQLSPEPVTIASVTFFRFLFFQWMGVAIFRLVVGLVCAPPKAASVDYVAGLHRDFELPAAYSERGRDCEASPVEMLAQAPCYAGDSGRVRPHSMPLVAWPESTKAVSTCGVVSEADSIVLQDWRQSVLNPESVAAELRDSLGVIRPYVDPELRFKPKSYAEFLKQLEAHGVITWRVSSEPASFSTGLFLAQKSNGKLRLAFDTRRDVLSIFNAVYRFMGAVGPHPGPLWPSVVRELSAAVALIPLWSASTRSAESPNAGDIVMGMPYLPDHMPLASTVKTMLPTEVIKASRARREHPGPLTLLRGGLSVLEASAVSESTGKNYHASALRFLNWCLWAARDFKNSVELDTILVVFFVHLFLDGYDSATGRVAMASLKHHLPSMLMGSRPLPRAFRALQGWTKLVPPQMRLPLPRVAMFAIVDVLLSQGLLSQAVFVRIAFDAHLRPGEAYRLTAASLIAPRSGATEGNQHWALLVNDAASGGPGKTGVTDESVIVDDPLLWPLLEALRQGRRAEESLWAFAPHQLRRAFAEALVQVGISDQQTSLYSLRHGGASDDLLSGRRARKEVKDRGRWRADQSLNRYAKRARMQQRLGQLDPALADFGQKVESDLLGLMDVMARTGIFSLPLPPLRPVSASAPVQAPPAMTDKWLFV
ncbi:unnamed protein product [Prorocentrum cordatum]|uniref:Uncharacterized protein n=1 Tax=Prorocentrum cordatum TaxID=2364126 RepID=A0ABN9RFQ3_9DINO|nr:unnamed protein product [Polarella glacialis]